MTLQAIAKEYDKERGRLVEAFDKIDLRSSPYRGVVAKVAKRIGVARSTLSVRLLRRNVEAMQMVESEILEILGRQLGADKDSEN